MASTNGGGIPRGPIGFRLANELEGLLVGVSADGIIAADETTRISKWLLANEQHDYIPPFSELSDHLERALQDGRLTIDECQDLLFVTRKLTTVNPYFDQIRGGVQVLMGLISGLSADKLLDVRELSTPSDWLEERSHLKDSWPYEECRAIICEIINARAVTPNVDALRALAQQFPVAGDVPGDEDFPPLLVGGVCAVDPDVGFGGKTFVFTGESQKADRARLRSPRCDTATAGSASLRRNNSARRAAPELGGPEQRSGARPAPTGARYDAHSWEKSGLKSGSTLRKRQTTQEIRRSTAGRPGRSSLGASGPPELTTKPRNQSATVVPPPRVDDCCREERCEQAENERRDIHPTSVSTRPLDRRHR